MGERDTEIDNSPKIIKSMNTYDEGKLKGIHNVSSKVFKPSLKKGLRYPRNISSAHPTRLNKLRNI